MTETEILIAIVAVLLLGLALPLSSGGRWTVFLLLIGVLAFAALGGGLQYIISLME